MLHTPYVPRLTSWFTAPHDWREVETGLVFQVGNQSFRVEAIRPRCEKMNRFQAWVYIRNLRTGRVFHETLASFWAGLDNSELGGGNALGVCISYSDHTKKAIARHNRKQARRRANLRALLVREGLVM